MQDRKILKIVTLLFLCLLLVSCSKKKEAVAYHNGFVTLQKEVAMKMMGLINTLEARNPDEMEKSYSELIKSVDDALGKAKAMAQFENDKGLKDAIVTLFEFYQSICKKEYREMLDTIKKTDITQADVDRLRDIETDVTNRENVLDDKVKKAQDDFAKEYGFQVTQQDADSFFKKQK